MTVANGTIRPAGAIRPPGMQARTAVVLMCATFVIGLLAGLVVPRLSAPASEQGAISVTPQAAGQAYLDSQAYQAYRAGERTALSVTAQAAGQAYQAYRAGERGDLVITPQAAEQAWLGYRAGERGDMVITPQAAEQAWLGYRAGERGDPGAP